MSTPLEIYLIRHGETAWSLSGQHTGNTDLALTEHGESVARQLAGRLQGIHFSLVLTSPRLRARMTCELAGLGDTAQTEPNLAEWDYGDYEGLTSEQIRSEHHPGWRIWFNGCPGGEDALTVRRRLTRVVERVRASGVDKAICFGHGHASRVLALCWMDFPLIFGQAFPLEVASISILGHEKESWAMLRWNS